MKIQKSLIDNSPEGYSMTEVLKTCISTDGIKNIRIATGYWDILGTELVYEQLNAFLKKDDVKVQLLIGKDPYIYSESVISATEKGYDRQEQALLLDLNGLELVDPLNNVVKLLVEHIADKKLEIHVYNPQGELKDQFFHAKSYIFDGKSEGDDIAFGILGSSNFTKKGLEGNSELNYIETDYLRVTSDKKPDSRQKSFIAWFYEKWSDSKEWEEQFLKIVGQSKHKEVLKGIELEPQPQPIAPLSPYELYIKLLQSRFADLVDKNLDEQIESYLPKRNEQTGEKGVMKLKYQMDAVIQCFNTMHEHGGFMLGDVVGLGKTIVGTLLIEHFLQNEFDDGRERRVLLITPPAIQPGWKETIERFDKSNAFKIGNKIDYITTGSVGKLSSSITEDDFDLDGDEQDTGEFDGALKQELYGLILIDESHKFRNSGTIMYHALDELIDYIQGVTGYAPFVGLLSATPQNNRPSDIQNQIYLFERNHVDSTLKKACGGNIEHFFSEVNTEFANILHDDSLTPQERTKALIANSAKIRECVLDSILVRRTRTDVKKYYQDDVQAQNMHFPEIDGPRPLEYKLDPVLAKLFSKSMELIAPNLEFNFDDSKYICYYRYRAIQFILDPQVRNLYKGGNLGVDRYSAQLARIMQMLLVKRIESSFIAFKHSLANLWRYSKTMELMWENDRIFICPQIDVNAEFAPLFEKQPKLTFQQCANNVVERINRLNAQGRNESQRNREIHRKDLDPRYIELLKDDIKLIEGLHLAWEKQLSDPKLKVFSDSLLPELMNKERNPEQLLVIFTEAIDTVYSLEKVVKEHHLRPLCITAKNRNNMRQTIVENFDANYDGKWQHDYDVIITTEVLAEGINLHRANTILNYDTPWNSTRLMQRIGRVNRIGSTAPFVYVYNFMPSAQGDAEIELVKKAHAKIQSFHTLFGEDSQVFTHDEQVMNYSIREVLEESESPMEKYVYLLKQYREAHPDRYEQILQYEDDLQMAASPSSGDYLYMVRNNAIRAMYFGYNHTTEQAYPLSAEAMFDAFCTDESAQRGDLPEQWSSGIKAVKSMFNQQLIRLTNQMSNSKRATDAKAILKGLGENIDTTTLEGKQMKKILATAFTLVNKGNVGIIRLVLQFAEQYNNDSDSLFALSIDDLQLRLGQYIEKVIEHTQLKLGEATVYIGLAK